MTIYFKTEMSKNAWFTSRMFGLPESYSEKHYMDLSIFTCRDVMLCSVQLNVAFTQYIYSLDSGETISISDIHACALTHHMRVEMSRPTPMQSMNTTQSKSFSVSTNPISNTRPKPTVDTGEEGKYTSNNKVNLFTLTH